MKAYCLLISVVFTGCGEEEYVRPNVNKRNIPINYPVASAYGIPVVTAEILGDDSPVSQDQNFTSVATLINIFDAPRASLVLPVTEGVYPGEVHRMHPAGENLHQQKAIPIRESTSAERVTHTGELVAVRDVSSNVPIHSGELVQPNEQNFRDLKKAFYACALEGCPTVSPKVEQYELELYLNSVLGVDALVWAGVGRKVLNVDVPSAALVAWASSLSDSDRMEKISRPLATELFDAKKVRLQRIVETFKLPDNIDMLLFWVNGGAATRGDLNGMTKIITEQSRTNGSICMRFVKILGDLLDSETVLSCQRHSLRSVETISKDLMKELQSVKPSVETKMIRKEIYKGYFLNGTSPIHFAGLSDEEINKDLVATLIEYLPVDATLWDKLIPGRQYDEYSIFVYFASLATREQLEEISNILLNKDRSSIDEKAKEWATKIQKLEFSSEDYVRFWINGGPMSLKAPAIKPIISKIVKEEIGRNGAVCIQETGDTIECEDSVEKNPTRIDQIITNLVDEYTKAFNEISAKKGSFSDGMDDVDN